MAVKTLSPKELEGRLLGARCLRAVGVAWAEADLSDVPDDLICEAIRQQEPEALRRYLEAVRNAGPEVERGFLCVLNDFIGSSLEDLDDIFIVRRYEQGPEQE